jgi:hypothetical protein
MVSQGLMDCETLVYPRAESLYLVLSEADVETLRRFVDLLASAPVAYELSWQLLEALEALARPEFDGVDEFVQSVLAIEGFLVPDVRHQVTDALTRRCAALLSPDFDAMAAAKAFFAFVYDVRSRIMHGSDPIAACSEAGVDPMYLGVIALTLLRRLIIGVTAFCRAEGEPRAAMRAFLRAIESAASHRDGFLMLRERTSVGVPEPLGADLKGFIQ